MTECRKIKPFWLWVFREFGFTTELCQKLVHLNNFEELNKMQFIIVIVAKATIWELRGILRKAMLPNILQSLKINFKYKLLTQLTTICEVYKTRNVSTASVEKYINVCRTKLRI